VLDNVEHLLPAAPALGDLLAACEGLTILATSRQPLHLRAEHEYGVLPLVLPNLDCLPSTEELAGIPAVDLFIHRAEVARRSFALTTENAPVLAEITVRLDGLPLAIELAAARIKVLAPAFLLERLEHRLPLLTGGAHDLPARQQTLRATLDWSHELLDADEQALFRRLAVFAGGFTLEAAEAVCDQASGNTSALNLSVLDGVTSLVEKSLVRVLGQDDDVRFGMLETVREYGWERLLSAREVSEVRDRHAAWCLALAERAEPELMGPNQQRWSDRLDAEHDNLRAAHAWSIERRRAEMALRLASAVQRFWTTRGLLGEGRRWLEQALEIDVPVPPSIRTKALVVSGVLAYYQGDYGQAVVLGEEALACSRLLDDPARIGAALGVLAMVAEASRELQRAETLFKEALSLFQLVNDRGRASGIINNLGLLAWRQGDNERAAALHEEALALRRELGDRVGQAGSLSNLGLVAADTGDYMRAKALEGESLKLEVELGNKRGLADSFENVARIADAMREDDRSAVLFGAAEALRVRLGFPPFPLDGDTNQRRIAKLRARLGESAFAAAWEVGREMSLDEAIAFALERSM
jgi:predicted ATPase/Tfp pilus assembly protein PilF